MNEWIYFEHLYYGNIGSTPLTYKEKIHNKVFIQVWEGLGRFFFSVPPLMIVSHGFLSASSLQSATGTRPPPAHWSTTSPSGWRPVTASGASWTRRSGPTAPSWGGSTTGRPSSTPSSGPPAPWLEEAPSSPWWSSPSICPSWASGSDASRHEEAGRI